MKKQKRGRHAPAFVLLLLAKKPAYGLEILNQLNDICAENTIDSAAIYRALKALENDKRLTSEWIESETGAPKKVYHITDSGRELLSEYKDDIALCINNLTNFIDIYNSLE